MMHDPCFTALGALWEQAQFSITRAVLRRPPLEGNLVSAFLGAFRGRNLFLSRNTQVDLRRYLQSYFVSGNVVAQWMGRPFQSVQFQPHEELIIMESVLENPTATLNDIFNEIYRNTGYDLNSLFPLSITT